MKKKFSSHLCFALILFVLSQIVHAWTSTKRLTWNSGNSLLPVIAIDSSNNNHVIWYDFTPGSPEIFYKKSTDGGSTWSGIKRLTWNLGWAAYPDITVDMSDNIHIAWRNDSPNYEIYYKKSTDGGATWTGAKRITWDPGMSDYPAIITDISNNIHLLWDDDKSGNKELYYKKSTDGGSTWSALQRLTWNSGDSDNAAVAYSPFSGHLHVVWEDDTPGNWDIYYKKSTDGGSTWSALQRLTWNSGDTRRPSIATNSSNNHVYVVWYDDTTGSDEIYYKESTDGGSTWSALQRLTWNSSPSIHPRIEIDAVSNIHIVYNDNAPGNLEVFYKLSTNGGTSWTTNRVTWASGFSWFPDLAIDSNNKPCVVWYDNASGNFEIYYKKES